MTTSTPPPPVTVPSLDEETIEARAADGSFERGLEYHEGKAVLSVITRGEEVQARVAGSRDEPYEVRLSTREEDLSRASCSCPDDRDGWCKHVVAVLLAARDDGEGLEERPSLEAEVGDLSREELEEAVLDLARSRAGVRDLLEARWETTRVLDGDGDADGDSGFDPGPFRRRVRMLLHGGEAGTGRDYDRARRTAEGIEELVALVERLMRAGHPRETLEGLGAILDAYLEGWRKLAGDGALLRETVRELVEVLAEALDRVDLSPAEREAWEERIRAWQEETARVGFRGAFRPALEALRAG